MHVGESVNIEQMPGNVKMCNEYYVSTCCGLCRSSGIHLKACPFLQASFERQGEELSIPALLAVLGRYACPPMPRSCRLFRLAAAHPPQRATYWLSGCRIGGEN